MSIKIYLLSVLLYTWLIGFSQSSNSEILIMTTGQFCDGSEGEYCLGYDYLCSSSTWCAMCIEAPGLDLCSRKITVISGTEGVDWEEVETNRYRFFRPGTYEVKVQAKGWSGIVWCTEFVDLTINNCVQGNVCTEESLEFTELEYDNSEYSSREAIYLRQGFDVRDGQKFRAYLCSSDKMLSENLSKDINLNEKMMINEKEKSQIIEFSEENENLKVTTHEYKDYGKKIECYPNPSSGVFTIENGLFQDDQFIIEISDLTGKMIKQESANAKIVAIDFSNHPNGTYIVKVQNDIYFWSQLLIIN